MSEERALQLVKRARLELERERARRSEPIAIIGMSCRLPGGVNSAAELWQLLIEGRNTVGEVPSNRWDSEAVYDADQEVSGKTYVKHGSFLDDVTGFEPEVFGISPREALSMDPQQRLLLETTWEALEDAGMSPGDTRGLAASVWMGTSLDDYSRRSLTSGIATRIDGHAALGAARSVIAGRIAYTFGFSGAAVALDTACSSSLVALHLACRSLRSGECDVAIVGAANVLCAPESTIALSKLRALSKDGRCKTFSADADGYGRGEGSAVAVLQRESDASRRGQRIRALIKGTAINHDGRSNGLTAPSSKAQESVIRAALSDASLQPDAVSYVEAHGTGTLLGDPIEVDALSRVYAEGRPHERPLYLGSIKTNLGHLESAAGLAGLLKVVLAFEHGMLPPHVTDSKLNPRIPWNELPLHVVQQATPWGTSTSPRVAGLSSFGISGTNAHVLLQEPPQPTIPGADLTRSAELFTLSARTPRSLRATAARLLSHLDRKPERATPYALAHGLFRGRATWPLRRAFVARTVGELKAELERLGEASDDELGRQAASAKAQLVGVFPDVAERWPFRALYATEDAFRAAADEFETELQRFTGLTLAGESSGGDDPTLRVVEHVVAQAALLRVWRSWGVVPDVVVGAGAGEIAAAYAAGALDAAQVIAAALPLSELTPERRDSAASHSHGRKPDAASRNTSAATTSEALLRWSSASLPCWSCSTGGVLEYEHSPALWAASLRSAECDSATLARLQEAGAGVFLEISTGATVQQALAQPGATLGAAVLPSLEAGRDPRETLLRSAARLYELGFRLDADGLFPASRRYFDLPTYAWQKQSYWLDLPRQTAPSPNDSAEVPLASGNAPSTPVAAVTTDSDPIQARVRHYIAQVLELQSPDSVDMAVPLENMGLDSVTALELRALLEESFSTSLPASLVELDSTAASLVEHLVLLENASAVPRNSVVEFACLNPLPTVAQRMYCFHDAGGGPDMFSEMTLLEAHGVEVHTVSLTRLQPPTAETAQQCLRSIVEYIEARADVPAILVGHSLGALFAWRVALELDDAGAPPLLSVLSAPPEREVSFEAVFQALDQAKESQILARLFAADIALYRAMPEPERAMLRSPISVIVGDKDHVVSEHAADAWRTRTSASFSLAVVPGDHFYVRDANCRRFLEREIATRVFTLTQLEKRHIGGTVASPAAPDAAFAASVQATTRYL